MFRRLIDDTRCHIPVIFVLSLLLYPPLLGARDFWGHENEYAEVTRVMLRERDFWFLQANEHSGHSTDLCLGLFLLPEFEVARRLVVTRYLDNKDLKSLYLNSERAYEARQGES